MNKTKIEWVKNPDGSQGYTWNPITGCLNGCEYCYARKLAKTRLKERYLANKNWDTRTPENYEGYPNLDPFYPRFWEDRLDDITPTQKARGIFVCDMSDLFGIGVPNDWTNIVLSYIASCPQHRFYLLTKQPQNLIKFSPFPDNCWVGVSATTDKQYMAGLKGLLDIIAKVRFISFEPLLEEVINNDRDHGFCNLLAYARINWVIIGSQTKPYKPPKIEWVKEIVEACDKAGVPVFLKDNLALVMNDGKWKVGEYKKLIDLRQEMPVCQHE